MASTPYKHFVPPVPLNPDYESTKKFVLIESLDQLKDSFKKGQVIAWDTETTGLNPIESEIVGFSYSYDGVTGYYCPVKHFDLALGKPALDLFYQALKDSKLQLLYNARFDIRMMEYSGYDMSFLYPKDQTGASHAMFFDVMNQVWLSDTNVPLPSLKSSTLHFLGYQPPKFLDTLGDEQNFQYVPAKDAYKYACFTGDTLIQTKHGLKQINQLTPLVDLIKTSTGYHLLLDILKQGVRDVIRVTTPSGTSFTCTPDHKFAVHIKDKLQWVQAKYLDRIPFYCLYRGGESLNSVEEEYTPQEPNTRIDTCTIEYLESPQFVYDLTIDGEHNFTLQCGAIAHNCLDAINTLNLFRVTYKYYKESGIAAQMDNQCIYIIGQLEKTPLNINTDYLIKLRDQVYNRVLELEQEIYSLAGHQFKIGSNRELTQVFIEQGIDTGERTKAGDMKTGIELLNLYLRNHPDCTLLNLIIEYKEQFKFYNSYLKTLVDIAKLQDTVPPRFSYKLQSVPCLTADNMVLLRDKGLVSVSLVQEGDFIWTQYGYKRVLWCNSHKSDNVYLVQFSNGLYIEGTGHHPVLVNNGTETEPKVEWATLESLNLNESVIFNHHTPPLSFHDEELNQKEKYMVYYIEDLGIFSSIYLNAFIGETDAYVQFKKDFFDSLSLPLLDSTVEFVGSDQSVISMVSLLSPNLWVYFIRGFLFATFETEQAQKWNIPESSQFIIKSDNPNLISFIMGVFYYLGIASTISTDETDQYTLSFTSQQSLSLLNILIIEDSESEYLKFLFSSFHLTSFYLEYADAQVVRKEKMEGEHTVYDIEVEDVHEFVANGVVTHNTGRFACGKDGKNTYFSPINLQCLEENTLVKTERGNIPIKDVKTGDKVWTGNQYAYCQQLGSKIKPCYKVKTYWGEIEASLEHNFLTLNIYHGYKIEWHTLNECITMGLPLVRDPQSLGIQFDELYNHPIFSDHSDTTFDYPQMYTKLCRQREELTLEQYKEALDTFKDFKFDIILETSPEFWKPFNPVFEESLKKTVYDLYVPGFNIFSANGFLVHNSLPKPKSIKCYGRKATQEEIENKQDTLGWVFSPDHPEWSPGQVVEGMSQTLNVRSAFQPEHPENGDYVVSIDMCVEAGSPVQTKRGYLGISELQIGDEVLTPNGYKKVIRVVETGKKKIKQIKTCGQSLYCSEDHPLIIEGHKVEARYIDFTLPKSQFNSFVPEIIEREEFKDALSEVRKRRTSCRKARYVLKHGLLPLIKEGLVKYSKANVCHWCGVPVTHSVSPFLKYLHLHPTGKKSNRVGTSFYHNPFMDNSTPTSAYLLGFIIGDRLFRQQGNTKSSVVVMRSHDKNHLQRIAEVFGSDAKIEYSRVCRKECWTLRIYDRAIYNRLLELGAGLDKNKQSNPIDFEWLGDNYRHFIRGLIDYRGVVSDINGTLNIEIISVPSVAKQIFNKDIGRWSICDKGRWDSSLHLLGLLNKDKQYLYSYLYEGSTIWLQSNRDIIENWFQNQFGDIEMSMWDITIDSEDHLYYLNGLLTHNCGEELRVVTNLFKEQNWAKVINAGGDLHHANSDALFGPENYTKETRKRSKGAAFGMLYGQEARGFQRKFPEMTLDEAKEFITKFKRIIPSITRGQERMIRDARKTGTFYSGFGRPRRVKHYLISADYKDVAFGERTCYSPDTEFLTKDGWALAKDIKEETLLAYYDPVTKSTNFTNAGARVTSLVKESIQYNGSSVAWNVTPDHRMWIRSTSKEKFRFIEAKDLLSIKGCQVIGCSYLDTALVDNSTIATPLGEYNREDLAELFGWLLTDGYISRNYDTISIGQSKVENFERLEILVSKFHGSYSVYKSNSKSKVVRIYRICRKSFTLWVLNQIKGRLKFDRQIPSWIFTSSLQVRKKFIEAMLLGDGRIRKERSSGSFDTPNKKIADGFQIILNLSGYRSIVRSYINRNGTQMYSVTYCTKEVINVDFRERKNKLSNLQKVTHDALEYSCFTVPTGILITRYKGKVCYMGNCKNGPIQGTAADVLKLEFIRLWDNIFTVYPEIKFICTIHDEINFSVPRHLADTVIPRLVKCMTVKMPDWLVTLDCSLSAGPALGEQYPFKYNFTTKEFVPDWEEDKRKESQESQVIEIDGDDTEDEEIFKDKQKEEDPVKEIDSKMFDF